jgi:hypothetical protein
MTPQERAVTLTLLNLSDIFGQKDVGKRLKNISDLWVPSNEVLFVDAMGVFKSHQAISDMVDEITSMGGPEDQFISLGTYTCPKEVCCGADSEGDVECLKHDEEDDVWVTKVKWGIKTSAGSELGLTGLDVLTIVGGKIKACYTFLDEKK